MASQNEGEQNYFRMGVEQHNEGNYEKAIEFYKKAMDSYGVDKKTLVLLGNAQYLCKEYKKAKENYKKALTLDPNYSKAYYNLGIVFEETKNYEKSVESFKKAIELEPDFGDAHANLGDVYLVKKEQEKAIIAYRKALDLDENNEIAKKGLKGIPEYLIEKTINRERRNQSDKLLRKGIKLETGGELLKAVKKYQESLKVFPKSAGAFILLHLIKAEGVSPIIKKEDISSLDLTPIFLRESISPEVREFLGKKLGNIALDQQTLASFFKRFQKKVASGDALDVDIQKVSEEILFSEPRNAISKALEWITEGTDDLAEKKFEDVISIAPYLTHAYYLYGLFQELREDETRAFSLYEKASEYNFDYVNDEIRAEIEEVFSMKDEYRYLKKLDIVLILKEFLENSLTDGVGSLLRFLKYKLSVEAEDRIKAGFEKEESGDSGEAISAYEDAINIDPSNPLAHYVLGLAYETRGLDKEAMESYEQTKGADFRGLESSETMSSIIESYLGKTTKDGHRVGAILSRYFEIIAEDPELMLELLGFIEDLNIESISKILKSHVSSEMILGRKGKDKTEEDGSGGKVIRDQLDFGENIDQEDEKVKRAESESSISFELLWKYKTSRSIRAEATSSDGNTILAGSENGIIYLIDQNAESPWRYDSGSNVLDIDISPDGKYGVYCNPRNIIELLDCVDNGNSLWKKEMGKTRVNAVAISGSGLIAAATNDFEVILFDIKGNKKKSFNPHEIIIALDITDDGNLILAASETKLYAFKFEKVLEELKVNLASGETIQSISVSGQGDYVSVGTRDGKLYLLDKKAEILWEKDLLNSVYGVSVTDEGSVVSGTVNGFVGLFSKEGERLWRYQTGENIWAVDISASGDRIICGCGLVFGNVYLFKI